MPLFWIGQLVSVFGSTFTTIVLPLYAVLGLHLNGAEVAAVTISGEVPELLAPLYAGPLADRADRGRLMLYGNVWCGLLLITVPVIAHLGWLDAAWLCAVNVALSLGGIVYSTAFFAAVPHLVPEADLPRVNGRYNSARTGAQASGAALAGLLMKLLGAAMVLAVDGGTYLLAAVAVIVGPINRRTDLKPTGPAQSADAKSSYLESVTGGFKAVANLRPVRALIITSGLFNFFVGGATVELMIYLARDCSFGSTGYALVLAAGSLGSVAGGLVAAKAVETVGYRLLFGLSLLCYGLASILYSLARSSSIGSFTVAAVGDFAVGFFVILYISNNATLRQLTVPKDLRGRISALGSAANSTLYPVGMGLGGLVGDTIGARHTIWLIAGGEMIVGCCLLLRRSSLAPESVPAPDPVPAGA